MEKRKIQYCVRSYTVRLCLICLVIGICMVMVLFTYIRSYNSVVDTIYSLKQMQDDIGVMRDSAGRFVLTRKETAAEEYEEGYRSAREGLRKAAALNCGGNYRRNITDMDALLVNYHDVLSVMIDSQTASSSTSVTSIYYSALRKGQVIMDEVQTYFYRQRNQTNRKLREIIILLLLVLIVGIFLILRNTSILVDTIVHPLEGLIRKVKDFWNSGEEVPETYFTEKSLSKNRTGSLTEIPEEIEILDHSFDEMSGRISEQVCQLKEDMEVREKLKEKEMENLKISNQLTLSELRGLQTQMRPHFLFNTLNMIEQTLYLDEKDKTSELLKETASYLRYSLDCSGKSVTLGRELEALGSYITLQEERLGERVLFEFQLDERLNSWSVPSLILQPLVENSIIHGLSNEKQTLLIRIMTFLDDGGNGKITVTDNGAGMSEEKLRLLKTGLNTGQTGAGVGLYNVCRRLQFFTERREVLSIESHEGEGTAVTITLYSEKEAEGHESFNCG